MEGYGLTTAEIACHLPDRHGLIQLYVWRQYILASRFPPLIDVLRYWTAPLDGPLQSLRCVHHLLIGLPSGGPSLA